MERCEYSIHSIDKQLGVIVLEREESSFEVLSVMQKLIDLDSLLLLGFMGFHDVVSDCLRWVFPNEKNWVVAPRH